MAQLYADFAKPEGRIRPLHGVNQGPMTKVFTYDARPLFREAAIPFARLHDTEYPYGSGEFVDIPCIFKNFEADETCEESYSFGLTDEYIKRILEVGCQPLFRLGVSIEHAPVKRYIYPPKDFDKWARICEHIIRHYNEGWANGYHWNLRYWEIWNEPEQANMWIGTREEFFRLYATTARHLKACFPDLMIGGCGFTTSSNSFVEGFFRYLTGEEERVPLDFFSWHGYFTNMNLIRERWKLSRELLDRYGYSDAENIFDEWNFVRSWKEQSAAYVRLKSEIGAAFCAAALCTMQQETDIAVGAYFEADVIKEWCGLFEVTEMRIGAVPATLGPRKPFYAFRTFGSLYRLGNAVRVSSDDDGVYACAASGDDGGMGLLLSVYEDADEGAEREVSFTLDGIRAGAVEVRCTDREKSDELIMTLAPSADGKLRFSMKLSCHTVLELRGK